MSLTVVYCSRDRPAVSVARGATEGPGQGWQVAAPDITGYVTVWTSYVRHEPSEPNRQLKSGKPFYPGRSTLAPVGQPVDIT